MSKLWSLSAPPPTGSDRGHSDSHDGPGDDPGAAFSHSGGGGAIQGSPGLQHDVPGQEVEAKWNRAYGQDAFAQGKHGDTSGGAPHELPVKSHSTSAPNRKTAGSTRISLSAKLWMLGATFATQIRNLHATSAELCGAAGFSPEDGFSVLHCAASCHYNICTSSPSGLEKCIGSPESLLVGDIVTLLEEAKDECFFVVCQVVADIWHTFSTEAAACKEPIPLSLEAAIPRSKFQADVETLQSLLPERRDIDFTMWQDWLDCDLQDVFAACTACPAIWDWLRRFGSWYDDPFDPEAVHLYTDGSAYNTGSGSVASASWAFNVWAIAGDQQAYLGHAFGITAPEHSPHHLGEINEDALTGEQLALAWALCWTLEASCAFRRAVFVFHFDNLAAGHGGFGKSRLPADSTSSKPTCLSRSVAILRQCAQMVCTVIGRHVPSHSGFAGNELADVLAKFAGRNREAADFVPKPTWPGLVIKHELAEWAWIAASDHSDLPALGAFEVEAKRLFAEAANRPFTFFAADGGHREGQTEDAQTVGIQLKLCTLNALSLREYDNLPQGLAVVGKRALLKQQFLQRQLHVVALQETRVQGDCIQPDADFIMLHSSCDSQGCFGCALWLSKALPVVHARHQAHYFTAAACTVLVAEPRLLVVQVDVPSFSVTYVSAHAPYDGHKTQHAAEFWSKVRNVVQDRPSGAQLVILTDSNGHIGSVSSGAVGTAGAESENQAGAAFHEFLVGLGLCLPSTFEDMHSGGHFTWRASSPFGHRLDYIAVPEEWTVGSLTSVVWYDFDHLHDADDHQPVILSCDLMHRAAATRTHVGPKAPRPRQDTDPGQLPCFQYVFENLPKVDWRIDVDVHYAAFAKSTLWCWSECVKTTSPKRCKPFVSDSTLEAIAHRRQVRDFLASESAALAKAHMLAGLFAFWLEWRQADPTIGQVQHLRRVLHRGRLHIASAVGCLGRLRLSLRKAIRSDRAAYLKRLADDVTSATLQQPKQLFAVVYKAFPVVRSKRRGGFCPLPAVLLENGNRARHVEERMQRWTEHFAKQEGGKIVPTAAFDREVRVQLPCAVKPPVFDIDCVPTLLDIEQDILRLRTVRPLALI